MFGRQLQMRVLLCEELSLSPGGAVLAPGLGQGLDLGGLIQIFDLWNIIDTLSQ